MACRLRSSPSLMLSSFLRLLSVLHTLTNTIVACSCNHKNTTGRQINFHLLRPVTNETHTRVDLGSKSGLGILSLRQCLTATSDVKLKIFNYFLVLFYGMYSQKCSPYKCNTLRSAFGSSASRLVRTSKRLP